MTVNEYSKAELSGFVDNSTRQGLVNRNTGSGWKAAISKILENMPDAMDVRQLDIKTEIRKYANAHPGELRPSSLEQYERRLGAMVREFQIYKESPSRYKGMGRQPNGDGKKKPIALKANQVAKSRASASLTTLPAVPESAHKHAGLTLSFPLRADYLAQIVIPRDMNTAEARRLSSFIMTLAQDFAPSTEGAA
jgi:hypothetical protein